MSPDPGGVFSVLYNLCRFGLGGIQGPGTQYVSWMHDQDYIRAVEFLIVKPEISGPVNFTSPNPLPNRDFMRAFRRAVGSPLGLPAPTPLLEIGTFLMRTESELVLKSRRAIPTVLLQHGFTFDFPNWPEAARDLVARYRSR
jgi:NAD dependent epimerase/dehydratase family enzyme